MTSLDVGAIDFINSLPFFACYKLNDQAAPWKITYDVPFSLNEQFEAGKLDISMVSSIHYLQHREEYHLIPELCIGAMGKVQSVALFLKCPIEALDQRTIGVPSHSLTSVELLRILCHHFWKVQPHIEVMPSNRTPQDYSAFLLIGDPCLKQPDLEYYTKIDLSEAWYYATGLGFTFAVFVAQKKLAKDSEILTQFQQDLIASLKWSSSHEEKLLSYASEKSGLSKETIHHYLQHLNFRLTPSLAKGLGRFAALSQSIDMMNLKLPNVQS